MQGFGIILHIGFEEQVMNEEMLKVPNKDSVLVADHVEGFKQLHRLQTDSTLALS